MDASAAEATTESSVSRVPLAGDASGLILVVAAAVNGWRNPTAPHSDVPTSQFGGSDAGIIDWAESAMLSWTTARWSISQADERRLQCQR
jgi:hypothetical protein